MNQNNYSVELTINICDASVDALKDSLLALGDDLNLNEIGQANAKARTVKTVKVHIRTVDPQLVFDACSQFGRLKSVKINETKR